MTLKEAYKQWSQQKENYQLYYNTRSLFGKVWSHLPFHLECSEYSDNDLAKSLSLSKNSYEDKVKITSVIIHVLEFGLGKPLSFSTSDVLNIHNRMNAVDNNNNNKENKPKPDIFKPLVYKDKPLIPQEVPNKNVKGYKHKPVYQLDVDGNLIKEWESVKVVAEAINVKTDTIYKAISAKFKVINSFWSRTPELTLVRERKRLSLKSEPKVKKDKVSKPEEDLLNSLSVLVSKIRKAGIKINVTIEL